MQPDKSTCAKLRPAGFVFFPSGDGTSRMTFAGQHFTHSPQPRQSALSKTGRGRIAPARSRPKIPSAKWSFFRESLYLMTKSFAGIRASPANEIASGSVFTSPRSAARRSTGILR
jgi:hypothetical protein